MPSYDQGHNWYQNASLGISNLISVQVSLCLMAVLECVPSLEPCRWLPVLAPHASGDMPWASVHSGVCSMGCVSPCSLCWCFRLLEQLQLGLMPGWEKGLMWGCLRPEPLGWCGVGCSRGFCHAAAMCSARWDWCSLGNVSLLLQMLAHCQPSPAGAVTVTLPRHTWHGVELLTAKLSWVLPPSLE